MQVHDMFPRNVCAFTVQFLKKISFQRDPGHKT